MRYCEHCDDGETEADYKFKPTEEWLCELCYELAKEDQEQFDATADVLLFGLEECKCGIIRHTCEYHADQQPASKVA